MGSLLRLAATFIFGACPARNRTQPNLLTRGKITALMLSV
jgi:hypothetical protein